MKKVIKIVIILCINIIFISCSFAQQQSSMSISKDTDDNPADNKVDLIKSTDIIKYTNNGYFASDGDWIYYSDNHLYRTKMDGSVKENLLDGLIMGEFFLVEDWVYFSGPGDINKIKLDGSQLTKIDHISADNLMVKNDWIYFRDEIEGDVYKIKDGDKDRVKLLDGYVSNFCFYDNDLYYASGYIFKANADGTDERKLSDGAFTNSNISIIDGWIYYANKNDENKLYKVKVDGTEIMKIADDSISFVKATKDWIYYIVEPDYFADEPTSGKIYRIKTNGMQREEIPYFSAGEPSSLSIVGDWIYYRELTNSDQYSIYRVKVDGSNTNVPNNGKWPERFPVTVATSSYLEENGINYAPKPNGKTQFTTLWIEGAKGNGIGEWIKLESTRVDSNDKKTGMIQSVKGIRILNGYIKSRELFLANNRVKKIQIEFSDGSSIVKELSDEFAEFDESIGEYFGIQEILFDRETDTTYIKISIVDVYKGNKYDDTCISGIQIF